MSSPIDFFQSERVAKYFNVPPSDLFHQISRAEAETLLNSDGAFLLRPSSITSWFTISFITNQIFYHCLMKIEHGHLITEDGNQYSSVEDFFGKFYYLNKPVVELDTLKQYAMNLLQTFNYDTLDQLKNTTLLEKNINTVRSTSDILNILEAIKQTIENCWVYAHPYLLLNRNTYDHLFQLSKDNLYHTKQQILALVSKACTAVHHAENEHRKNRYSSYDNKREEIRTRIHNSKIRISQLEKELAESKDLNNAILGRMYLELSAIISCWGSFYSDYESLPNIFSV